MEGKRSTKIIEIVRLHEILKKWKKLANISTKTADNTTANTGACNRGFNKFLKKTLSFSESHYTFISPRETARYPKGYLAVCVGKHHNELQKFVIPTQFLGHEAFQVLLREAEEEFGFEQQGVLKIPCHVSVFEMIVKIVEDKRDYHHNLFCFMVQNDYDYDYDNDCFSASCSPSHSGILLPSLPQLCR